MTTPVPVKPTNKKAWTATIGSLLVSAIPLIGQLAGLLPAPYGAALSGIMALLTPLVGAATYQAPYKPPNTELVATPSGDRPQTPWPSS